MRETITLRRTFRAALALSMAGAMMSPAQAQPPQPAPADWRARLQATARAAGFESERAPVADETAVGTVSPTGLPQMTFAPATGARGDVGIAGRITSSADYAPLGIARGVNYLWVDTRSKPVRMAIIPADADRPAYWLAVAPHPQSSTSSLCRTSPRATQLGFGRSAAGGSGSTPRMAMAACTCVNGVWMHGSHADEMLSRENVRALLSQ